MQDRVRTWLPPPHETEQEDQEDHSVQPPGTVRGQDKVRVVRWQVVKTQRLGWDPCSTEGGIVCVCLVWGEQKTEEMSYKA